MVLPFDNEEFLKDALLVSKKNTVIHMYSILNESGVDKFKAKLRKESFIEGF